jgi:hypothetical protein
VRVFESESCVRASDVTCTSNVVSPLKSASFDTSESKKLTWDSPERIDLVFACSKVTKILDKLNSSAIFLLVIYLTMLENALMCRTIHTFGKLSEVKKEQ